MRAADDLVFAMEQLTECQVPPDGADDELIEECAEAFENAHDRFLHARDRFGSSCTFVYDDLLSNGLEHAHEALHQFQIELPELETWLLGVSSMPGYAGWWQRQIDFTNAIMACHMRVEHLAAGARPRVRAEYHRLKKRYLETPLENEVSKPPSQAA